MSRAFKLFLSVFFIFIIQFCELQAAGRWYNHYQEGLDKMEMKQYAVAIEKFLSALRVQNSDKLKIKTYGMHFIEYFPNREIGVCYYHLGDNQKALSYLKASIQQAYSARAQQFVQLIEGGTAPQISVPKPPEPSNLQGTKTSQPPTKEPLLPSVPEKLKLVGERMGIAVLPFETKGLGAQSSEIDVIDQLITSLVNLNRFKVMERAQIESVLEEQKLGMSGIVDVSTAAAIGKGIGVDAIMLGSLTSSRSSMSIDARLIDTETAQIITAKDEFSSYTNIQYLKNMITGVVKKIADDLPLVNGYVIQVDDDILILDGGTEKGLKKGMKCIIYREGEEIRHPKTGAVLGKKIEELAEAKFIEVYGSYSNVKITKLKDETNEIRIEDRFITK